MVRDNSFAYTSDPLQYDYTCPKCGTKKIGTLTEDEDVEEEPGSKVFDYDKILKEQMGIVESIKLDEQGAAVEYAKLSRDAMYESFRAKAAIQILAGLVVDWRKNFNKPAYEYKEQLAYESIALANALIDKLKGE